MMRFAPFTRDFYIPKGSVRIADRNSDGVVYVYRSEEPVRCHGFSWQGRQTRLASQLCQ